MILGFKEFLDTKKQKPTNFREKILAGPRVRAFEHDGTMYRYSIDEVAAAEAFNERRPFVPPVLPNPKLHTIREDNHDLWKAGRSIQMVYRGAGYKIKDEFNKGIPELEKCISTQKIEIKWSKDTSEIGKLADMMGIEHKDVEVKIDGKWYATVRFSAGNAGNNHRDENDLLYENDGFDNLFDFFAYFKKDFTGKIIHWTDLRY